MILHPSDRGDVATFDDYLRSLSARYDSYLENAVIESQFYRVSIDGREAGAIAVHDNTLLTYFHLVGPARQQAADVWARAMAEFPITAAYVPTCDEQFLSQALEDFREIKKQACIFQEGSPVSSRSDARVTYRPAKPSDAAEIRALSGDFLDPLEQRLKDREVRAGSIGGEIVAVGLAEPSRFFDGYASIGMFTHEGHRNRGTGTATIRHMRDVCRAEGITPVAGCWYYNHGSRRTLEAAGMVTQTRLLRIEYDRPA